MNGPRIASFCTGYGGLDHAVQAIFGGEPAWVSDIDPGACQIITHRMPGVPNIGDLTTADYHALIEERGRPDITLGGYPCQPFSTAGRRLGVKDERHLWPDIARALGVLRPRIAIFENVAGHLRLGFDIVLTDLARLGFDVEWCLVRASEIGAPHRRSRLFIYATSTDAASPRREGADPQRGRASGNGGPPAHAADLGHERGRGARHGRPGPADSDLTAAHADGGRLARHTQRHVGPDEPGQQAPLGDDPQRPGIQRSAAAHTARGGHANGTLRDHRVQLLTEPRTGSRVGLGSDAEGADGLGEGTAVVAWGAFEPAVRRWEHTLGRPAPRPVDDRRRLNPPFVEWMQGLPAGWVTDVPGLTRTQQLKALGNGVVPAQAEAAIRLLHARATQGAAA